MNSAIAYVLPAADKHFVVVGGGPNKGFQSQVNAYKEAQRRNLELLKRIEKTVTENEWNSDLYQFFVDTFGIVD